MNPGIVYVWIRVQDAASPSASWIFEDNVDFPGLIRL